MKNIKYIIIALGILVAVWLIPAAYELIAPQTDKAPFVLYSCLDSTFIQVRVQDKTVHYTDFKGQTFTKQEADSLLPLFSYRQLLAEGRMPDSLFGIALNPKLIQHNTFHFKTSPKQLNKPAMGLYTMLESASGRVDLTLPNDVFRLKKDGLEFIDCETNKVLPAKSRSFTRELTKHGFTFPVKLIWGNGTTRKDYDNGFLLTDSNDRLFQLKMVKGTPFVRQIKNLKSQIINHKYTNLFVIEPANRQLIGLVVTDEHQLYAVKSDGTLAEIGRCDTSLVHRTSSLCPLSYDPQQMQISIVGDLLHWTITLYTATDTRYYAVSADDFTLVDSAIVPDPQKSWKQKLVRYLLPIRLRFTSWQTQLIQPNINDDNY